MKNSLLVVGTEETINIGDYIQALASSQFMPQLDSFVEREELKQYDGEDTRIIMNGWYMHHPEQWPPSDKIHPLFVAVHFNILAKDVLLGKTSIEYLKKHEPIGCRDKYTAEQLTKAGIDAYFSGCLTLTLGQKYKDTTSIRSGVYFVDPKLKPCSSKECFKLIPKLICNFAKIIKIVRNNPLAERKIYNLFRCADFYNVFSPVFCDDILTEAIFISQQSTSYKTEYGTNEELLLCAEGLVRKYAKAKLVVTGRIHCALPCLGLETPVLYMYDDNQSEVSRCRLDGLMELFNTIHINNRTLKYNNPRKVSLNNIPNNSGLWKKMAKQLIIRCNDFMKL